MNEINVNEENFESEILNSNIPVLLDFWAPWCGPCKMLSTIVEEIADEYTGKIKVAKINTDENESLALEFGINSIPALFLIKDAQVVKTSIGYKTKQELIQHFELDKI